MDKTYIKIYQDLHNLKAAKKGVILDYSEKIKDFISSLQNKSYIVIEYTIHHRFKIIAISNDTNISEVS